MKMGKVLSKTVAVWDEDLGRRVKFYPGDELPEKFEDKVTNPAVFRAENEMPEDDGEEKALKSLTVQKLRDLADEEGVDLSGLNKKADIIAAIERHREDAEDDESFDTGEDGNGEPD